MDSGVYDFLEMLRRPDDWRVDALCAQADSAVFFPKKGGSARAAKGVCSRCVAQPACLEYALANPDLEGVWGGTTERERHGMRREETAA